MARAASTLRRRPRFDLTPISPAITILGLYARDSACIWTILNRARLDESACASRCSTLGSVPSLQHMGSLDETLALGTISFVFSLFGIALGALLTSAPEAARASKAIVLVFP